MAAQFKILVSLLIDKRLKGKIKNIQDRRERKIRTKIGSAQTINYSG